MNTIGIALAEQYDRAWEMLRATIERFTEDQWRAGERPELVPGRWALHAVEGAEYYVQQVPEDIPLGATFGEEWEQDPRQLPSRDRVLEYLDAVRCSARATLQAMPDTHLQSADEACPWCGGTVLQRMLYALRHMMTHHGELSMLLRLHGAEETEWR